MKRILLGIALVASLGASAAENLVTLTTTATGTARYYFKAKNDSTKVIFKVNGETTDTLVIKKANSQTSLSVKLPTQASNTVEVLAEDILAVNVSNCKMTDVKFGTQASTVTEVRVNGNTLTNLAFVGDLPALKILYAGNNKEITALNINCPTLTELNLDNMPNLTQCTLTTPELTILTLNKSQVASLDLSAMSKMWKLNLKDDAVLANLKLGSGEAMEELTVTNNPKLTAMSVKNMPLLKKLHFTGCSNLETLEIENLPIMWSLNLTSTHLSTLTIKDCPMPDGDLQISGCTLEAFAPDTPGIWTMTINESEIKNLDLSKLSLLRNIQAKDGNLEKIVLNETALQTSMTQLMLTNNNLTLVNLPPRPKNANAALNYYAPQKVKPTIPDLIYKNGKVDLSEWMYGQSLEGNVASQVVWETSLEEILEEGTDYTVENGVFTFLHPMEEQVRAIITNTAFPAFKLTQSGNKVTDYRLMTNYATLSDEEDPNVGIEGVGSESTFEVKVSGTTLSVAAEGEVSVYDLTGACYYKGGSGSVNLSKGVYIVRSGKNGKKVVL